MGYPSSTLRSLLIISFASTLMLMPPADAEKETHSYTVPNSTDISIGYVNDTFYLNAGDEVTISWVADGSLYWFDIECDEFMNEHWMGGANGGLRPKGWCQR